MSLGREEGPVLSPAQRFLAHVEWPPWAALTQNQDAAISNSWNPGMLSLSDLWDV